MSLVKVPLLHTATMGEFISRIILQSLAFAKANSNQNQTLFTSARSCCGSFKKVATPFGQVSIFLLPEAETQLSRMIWIRSLRAYALPLWFKFKCPPHFIHRTIFERTYPNDRGIEPSSYLLTWNSPW